MAVGVAALGLLGAQAGADDPPAEYVVETRVMGRSVHESGRLISLDSAPVVVGITGNLLEIPRSGARVQEGAVILRVDDTEARDRLKEVLFNTHDAEEIRDSCAADYDYAVCLESNRLALLEKELVSARMREEDARAGLKPADRRLLEIELELARLTLADARDELVRQERLHEKDFISLAMLETFQRKAETAEASVRENEAQIRLKAKGAPEEQLLELRRQVERIEALLSRSGKARERRLEYARRAIDVAQARIEENRHDRRQVDDDLAATAVRAPKGGILSVRKYFEAQTGLWTEYKPGDRVEKYDVIADVVNPGQVRVELMIHETDIDQVAVGTAARIRLPAYPDRTFQGEVVELGGVGRDRADVAPRGSETGRTGVNMFNAEVSLQGNGLEFRPGMSALVELLVAPPQPRTVVPRAAVMRENGGFHVLRKEDGRWRKVEIRGRVFDESFFLVEKGLAAGDVVAAAPPEGRV